MANMPAATGDPTYPGKWAAGVTVNTSTIDICRAVYIGADDNYDFYLDNSDNTGTHQAGWVQFSNCKAGTVLPIQAIGARHSSGSTAPDANDIVFIY